MAIFKTSNGDQYQVNEKVEVKDGKIFIDNKWINEHKMLPKQTNF